jgi:hypothetical protein
LEAPEHPKKLNARRRRREQAGMMRGTWRSFIAVSFGSFL